MLSKDIITKVSDSKPNRMLLDRFVKKYRRTEDEYATEKIVEELATRGAIYTPTDDYIEKAFGAKMKEHFKEFYQNKENELLGCLAVPIFTLNDTHLGFIQNRPKSQVKYKYPESYISKKSTMLFMLSKSFIKALERGYIILVEGVFDEIFITALDEPGCGINGTTLNIQLASIINLIPNKIVIADNDVAGSRMYATLDKRLKGNIVTIKLPTKDIAEYLTNKQNMDTFKGAIDMGRSCGFSSKLITL